MKAMKKMLAGLLVLVMALSLAACGGSADSGSSGDSGSGGSFSQGHSCDVVLIELSDLSGGFFVNHCAAVFNSVSVRSMSHVLTSFLEA